METVLVVEWWLGEGKKGDVISWWELITEWQNKRVDKVDERKMEIRGRKEAIIPASKEVWSMRWSVKWTANME